MKTYLLHGNESCSVMAQHLALTNTGEERDKSDKDKAGKNKVLCALFAACVVEFGLCLGGHSALGASSVDHSL